MTVGSTLKYHRKKANLSQIELAHKLHVSRQSISSWENDHSYPSLDNLISLSRIYQTSIEDLLKDNEPLRKKLAVHHNQLLEYEQKICQIQTQIDNLNQELNYDKEDEFLFCITLIFIGITLAPLGLVIPVIYFINKKKKRKKRFFEKDS
ncbi:helix-turn-helix transcriptional regulator [Enterococcus hirae]|uniref:helix-turn-helix transcriptional regulator n=1 Tax=Enterococcus hirae TaxID=1354 RepID=UPI001A968CF2|nr:helix-turn-helix transcriptional regulator [Enterococcus hirae]MBO1103692.1 helix-turn-helix transcriptional regulator [Enterococcus hirae]